MSVKIEEKHVKKLSSVINRGLSYGVGHPVPGQMCVEAAICYVFGEMHDDHPKCVNEHVTELSITLNDCYHRLSKRKRAEILKPFAIAQLGTDSPAFCQDTFDKHVFKIVKEALAEFLAMVLREKDIVEKLRVMSSLSEPELSHLAFDLNKLIHSGRYRALIDLNIRQLHKFLTTEMYFSDATQSVYNIFSATEKQSKLRHKDVCQLLQNIVDDVTRVLVDMKTPGSKWIQCIDIDKERNI